MKNLIERLKFIELIDEMKYIERFMFLKNGRRETDAEHSYHLAIMVMTFIDEYTDLEYEKCLKFALLHDIIEIYAGDTNIYDTEAKKTKSLREANALIQLEKEFKSVVPEVISLIHEYEKMDTREARFVYSLDKIQPIIQNVLEKGQKWKNHAITLEEAKKVAYDKIYPEFGLEEVLDIYFEKAINSGYFK